MPLQGELNDGSDADMEDEGRVAHLLPRVMVPFVTKRGETPRKVLIQRCERETGTCKWPPRMAHEQTA